MKTVSELIKTLQELPPDLPVAVVDQESGWYMFARRVYVSEAPKKNHGARPWLVDASVHPVKEITDVAEVLVID